MSANTDTKLDSSSQHAEPKSVHSETDQISSSKGNQAEHKAEADSSTEKHSYTEIATNAASTAASSATAVAAGVKDNVFSMFGGGVKKEKKEDAEDGADEPSGSSKAKKEAEGEVRCWPSLGRASPYGRGLMSCVSCRRKNPTLRKYTSSLWSISRRKLIRKRTRSWRSRPLRCVRSSSSSTVKVRNGKSVEPET